MKIAVLISGQMRTAELCHPSIKKHVLDVIGPHDVYGHISDDEQAGSLMLFNPVKSIVCKQPDLDEKNYIHRTGRQVFGVQRVLRMWWSMYESWRLAGEDYDFYIRLRPDTQFFSSVEIPETWAVGATIPKHNNWWGYCDRFAILSKDAAKVYHSMWPNLDEYIAQGGMFHPETYLKWTLDRAGVPIHRTSVMFDSVRLEGGRAIPLKHQLTGDVMD